MCGIVGFITGETGTKYSNDRYNFMRDGLIMDTVRGADATGVFMAPHLWHKSVQPHQRQAHYLKDDVPGPLFVHDKDFATKLLPIRDWRAVVGHNRAATRGSRGKEGAHPFQEGPITLVHNGTLTHTSTMPRTMHELNSRREEGEPTINVDSHVLCHNLALAAVDEVPALLATVPGAYALVWHDARDDSVNIARNSQRPLHMAYSKDDETIYFMSESEMLYSLARRSTINLREMFYPKPGILMKWLPTTKVNDPIIDTFSVYSPPTYVYGGGYYKSGSGVYGGYFDNDDLDDAYAANRPAVSPGKTKAETGKEDNRVLLCGRRRDIPTLAQANLTALGLSPDDRLSFLPHQPRIPVAKPKNGVLNRVEGLAFGGNSYVRYDAVVYGVDSKVHDAELNIKINERRPWRVRPVAVRFDNKPNGAPGCTIVCKWMGFELDEVMRDLPECVPGATKEEQQLAQDLEITKIMDGQIMILGPNEEYVPIDKYKQLVAQGCGLCSTKLSFADYDYIEWYGDAPVCTNCVDDMEEEDEADREAFTMLEEEKE